MISKLMTQALRFFNSRCSTAKTSPSTTTMPMSSSRVFMGTGFFLICRLPKIRLAEKTFSASWAAMASFMARWRRASVWRKIRSCSLIWGSARAGGSSVAGGASSKMNGGSSGGGASSKTKGGSSSGSVLSWAQQMAGSGAMGIRTARLRL